MYHLALTMLYIAAANGLQWTRTVSTAFNQTANIPLNTSCANLSFLQMPGRDFSPAAVQMQGRR